MRLNLTTEEGKHLATILKQSKHMASCGLLNKVTQAQALENVDRTDFTEGDVHLKRMKGSEFSDIDKRTVGVTHWGWRLTHLPTGKVQNLLPPRNANIGRKYAIIVAKHHQNCCEHELRMAAKK